MVKFVLTSSNNLNFVRSKFGKVRLENCVRGNCHRIEWERDFLMAKEVVDHDWTWLWARRTSKYSKVCPTMHPNHLYEHFFFLHSQVSLVVVERFSLFNIISMTHNEWLPSGERFFEREKKSGGNRNMGESPCLSSLPPSFTC